MATAAGIYWCLVLTRCISLAVSTPSVFQYTQTSPTYPIVCPGDRIVLTCIVTGTGGAVGWQVNEGHQTILISGSSSSDTYDSFFLNITESNSTTLISLAINDSASVTLDGANVSCIADGGYTEQLIIDVANPPGSVNTVSIDAINNSALFISWNYDNYKEEHCVSYNINVTANGTLHDINNSSYSNYTHTSLTIGTNYSFIIIPIDTIGREGPPSSLIQYIWNVLIVPAQVVNISWDQISTDSITIWWNNNEDYIPVPPTQYYIINVYKTLNSIIYTNNTANTNTTITGLPLTDTNYTVSIIPVNVIGYGPSVNVLFITLTSSNIPFSTITSGSFVTVTSFIRSKGTTAAQSMIAITELVTETISERSYSSCITTTYTMSQSPDAGSIGVAIAVPITGLLTGLITSVITSIIVYCIMKNKGKKQQQGGGAAIYDLPIIIKQQDINTHTNTAYGHINY